MSKHKKIKFDVDDFDKIFQNKKSKSKTKNINTDSDEDTSSSFTSSSSDSDKDEKSNEARLRDAYLKYKQLKKDKSVTSKKSSEKEVFHKKTSDSKKSKQSSSSQMSNLNVTYTYFNDPIINNVTTPLNIIYLSTQSSNNINILISNNTYNDGDLLIFFLFGNKTDNILLYTKYNIIGYETLDNNKQPFKYSLPYTKELKMLLIKNNWVILN